MNTNSPLITDWDLSPLGVNDATFELPRDMEDVIKANNTFINKWKSDPTYLSDPAVLLRALDEYENLLAKYDISGNPGFYYDLKSTLNQEDTQIKGIQNKITEIGINLLNDREFFLLNLGKVAKESQDAFLAYPGLKKYKHFLEKLFSDAKYHLTDAEEKIINLTSMSSYGNWVRMTSDLISREEREVLNAAKKPEKTHVAEIIELMSNPDKEIRDTAANVYNSILEDYVDVAEAEINSIITNKSNIDKLRGFNRPDAPSLVDEDTELETVDTLIYTVSSRYEISQKFYEFKAKLLGQPFLDYHERAVNYGKISEKKYTYEEAVSLVKEVISSVDPEFLQIYEYLLQNGRYDVYPRKGKMYGAFCAPGLKDQPGYILLNHMGQLTDVTTIAHETGHAINYELIRKKQNALNYEVSLSIAEVASTFMEDFVLDKLQETPDEELRLAIMVKRLEEDVAAIMRQVACYKFEQDLHKNIIEKGYLSKTEIGELFNKNMLEYMGPAVHAGKGSENWWVYWSHIRMFFYVFSYASGLLISKSLQESYKKDHSFILKIKEFLSAGASDSPEHIFSNLGINIKDSAFWLNGLSQTEKRLEEAQVLAKKLGKI